MEIFLTVLKEEVQWTESNPSGFSHLITFMLPEIPYGAAIGDFVLWGNGSINIGEPLANFLIGYYTTLVLLYFAIKKS